MSLILLILGNMAAIYFSARTSDKCKLSFIEYMAMLIIILSVVDWSWHAKENTKKIIDNQKIILEKIEKLNK